ncbi:Branched-chain amino acid ABC transporter permease [Bosea sp. 62]|uniref:branched-chain amino acid ABC transporter permease n=1 Tax=unclassified Bosea (in: a-proteobacteria) TaxID=2653178 RepID=UPI00125B3FDC|nr:MULTISPECIES: branched-chain amino acid ABC transporter permease [unclassified Bosea (in: a-proteobacteria)]CAD5253765.1 Branched-chain amino acid ABC transporter permease [Bosea sp. 21B]CAD5287087.1 Branched-chain amino acid ABC transporter permease [Bosea sp. 7B]CAD5301203.1 Branched-chain amino acid ABC transporter permease [Bosea sp. 46]VVT57332.1 Branched-chain amino acid transport system permease protein [Bosea sp. EC-HK365B]VXB65984.1 Branched-chain amino acid ABC transporter permeas
MDWILLAELSTNGVFVGLMYALVSLGIVLIYKTSGTANLAQGAIAMTGGYVTWALATLVGLPIWLAIPAALVGMFGFGLLMERIALRRMIGQPVIMTIMLTLGVEIMLRGLLPGIFGAAVKRLDIGMPQQPLFVGELLLNRSTMIGGSISLLLILLSLFFFNSRFGVVMRAVADDQTASWSVGIRVERAIAVAWGLAAVSATAAGVLWGSTQGIDWSLSLLLIKALAIAILGGLDSIPGVLVAGVIVGVAESLATGVLDPLVGGGSRDVVAAVIILVTLLLKPHGLFGRHHIERV